jgi:hypothetical protein
MRCGDGPVDVLLVAAPTRDHIRPRSKGGTLAPHNKVLACDPCNQDKGSRSLASWLYRLASAGDPRAAIIEASFPNTRASGPSRCELVYTRMHSLMVANPRRPYSTGPKASAPHVRHS